MRSNGNLQEIIKDYWQLGLLIVIVVGGFYQLKLDIVRIEGKFEGYSYLSDRVSKVEDRATAHDVELVGIQKDIQRCIENLQQQ
jgi:hypothetical protein